MSRNAEPTPAAEPDLDALFAAARMAQARAYAPYSRFRVGAALLADDGVVYSGCNVENAAYPSGTCAEQGAISAMIAGGGRAIMALLVHGEGEELVTPCGACRQRIREFAEPETPVAIAGPEGIRARFSMAALLPASFGPANLRR
jgi:cytidine deaminase